MFANRYTALVDACSLAGALKRNMLLTLAEAEFFRLRWSMQILDETQAAIAKMLQRKGVEDAEARADRARRQMMIAFEEADVGDFSAHLPSCVDIPDVKDHHVLAAALQTKASVLVTDNLSDFPEDILDALGLHARSTDVFLADTIALDEGRGVAAIRRMRLRLNRPGKTPEALLVDMEASGLLETASLLRGHVGSL